MAESGQAHSVLLLQLGPKGKMEKTDRLGTKGGNTFWQNTLLRHRTFILSDTQWAPITSETASCCPAPRSSRGSNTAAAPASHRSPNVVLYWTRDAFSFLACPSDLKSPLPHKLLCESYAVSLSPNRWESLLLIQVTSHISSLSSPPLYVLQTGKALRAGLWVLICYLQCLLRWPGHSRHQWRGEGKERRARKWRERRRCLDDHILHILQKEFWHWETISLNEAFQQRNTQITVHSLRFTILGIFF